MVQTDYDYRRFLADELENRQKRNPGYSLRAFARDLGFPVSKLSEILRGRAGLSAQSGAKLAKVLRLTVEESQWFLLSIASQHARSPLQRKKAQQEFKELSTRENFEEINLEKFKVVADWYHFAILELTDVDGFRSEPGWIARRLGLEKPVVEAAIERLIAAGLLERSAGQLRQTHANLATPSGIPSREIRRHHSQILMKADQALEEIPVGERDFSAMTMLLSAEQMTEARHLIKDFRRKFDALMKERGGRKKRVYGFSIQLFPMDRLEGDA